MIVYTKRFLNHNLTGHPECRERLSATVDFLEGKGVFDTLQVVEPGQAEAEDILRVHSQSHFENMKGIAESGTQVLGDTYYNPESFETALLAAGAVIDCVNSECKAGFALVRPPGHHATRNSSMGFCIFNNVAVGAAYAKTQGKRKIAILDFDVHHGNGTQDIFYESDILYISLHQWPHYPGTGAAEEVGEERGEGYTVNIPLPGGVTDTGYNLALDEIVYPVLTDYSPDILLVSAGYDAHQNDPLGGLKLSTDTYHRISENVKKLAKKTVFTLEGGYNITALPHCIYASLAGLFDLDPETYDFEQAENEQIAMHVEQTVKNIRKTVSEYWNI